jgi:hypothetical protein
MSDAHEKNGNPVTKKAASSSRRAFLAAAAATTGGVLLKSEKLSGQTAIPTIRIPRAVEESLSAPVRRADFSG